jgi:glycosyltransferase involved in cell wall biosynthesis
VHFFCTATTGVGGWSERKDLRKLLLTIAIFGIMVALYAIYEQTTGNILFLLRGESADRLATAVIEGMIAGRPAVAIKAGSMPEMIEDRVTGLLVPPRDPEAMAQAILYYYRDRDRSRQLALAGRKRATTDLTAERHVKRFYALYHTLLA